MAGPRTKRILVVEDSDDVARMLLLLLVQDGHTVEIARNGAEALARTSSFDPDTIVLDLVLPDIPGENIAAQLRARDQNVRIVGITGGAVAALTAEQRQPFDALLQKPFAIDELLARV